MEFEAIIKQVRARLSQLDVACETEAGPRVTDSALSQAESQMGVSLPPDLRRFYESIGDGFRLWWDENPRQRRSPCGGFEVPTLSYLASMYLGWRRISLFTPEAAEAYGFPHTRNPSLAKQTAARMWHWLPVLEEGNGDMICIDLSAPRHAAIFNQHDWLDGGTGDNGHVLAPSWGQFMLDWSQVCFQSPKSLWWPACFSQPSGVDWNGDEFCEPFRLAGN